MDEYPVVAAMNVFVCEIQHNVPERIVVGADVGLHFNVPLGLGYRVKLPRAKWKLRAPISNDYARGVAVL